MAAREKRQHITVRTVPNGYAVDINGKKYMAMGTHELCAVIFSHVALNIPDYIDRELSNNIVQAAAQWPTVGKALEANALLMTKNNELRKLLNKKPKYK